MQFLIPLLSLTVCFVKAQPETPKAPTYTTHPSELGPKTEFTLSHPTNEKVFFLCRHGYVNPEMRTAKQISALHYTTTNARIDGVYILPSEEKNTKNPKFTKVEAAPTFIWEYAQHLWQTVGNGVISVFGMTPKSLVYGVEPEQVLRWAMKQWPEKLKTEPGRDYLKISENGDGVRERMKLARIHACGHLGILWTAQDAQDANNAISEAACESRRRQLQTAKNIMEMPMEDYIHEYRATDFEYLAELAIFISNAETVWDRLADKYRLPRTKEDKVIGDSFETSMTGS